eukprot:2293006-Amphidinium_carterae.1
MVGGSLERALLIPPVMLIHSSEYQIGLPTCEDDCDLLFLCFNSRASRQIACKWWSAAARLLPPQEGIDLKGQDPALAATYGFVLGEDRQHMRPWYHSRVRL